MDVLWVIGALLLAGFGGWPVTATVLKLAGTVGSTRAGTESVGGTDGGAPSAGVDDGQSEPHISQAAAANVLHGGLLIGILERVGVALAIMLDQSVAIAYIVAVKGLGRYPELKEVPAASERFIIGTLTSLLWAVIVSVLVRIWLF